MSWSYRVVKETLRGPRRAWKGRRDAVPAEVFYTIREVYDSGAFTATGTFASGETLDELKADLARQLKAFDQPVLEVEAEALIPCRTPAE